MRLNSSIVTQLENSLSNFLQGMSLKAWAENKVSHLLKVTGQTSPPLELEESGRLLQKMKIKKIRYRLGLSERGRLAIEGDGFVVESLPPRKTPSTRNWVRLTIAHEVAHTLFYNIENWPPIPRIYMEPGNRDLEWFCWYLARCFLVPVEWLRNQIEHFPKLDSEGFSLNILYKLETVFSVPWRIVAQRLVEDLGLWNCVILQFIMINEVGKSSVKRAVWRLKWQTIPLEGSEGLFIPVGHRIEGIMKFPKARGALAQFIAECIEHGQRESFFYRHINYRVLNTSATGNLGKFLYENLRTQEIKVYCSVRTLLQNDMFDGGQSQPDPSFIIMCFPLESF